MYGRVLFAPREEKDPIQQGELELDLQKDFLTQMKGLECKERKKDTGKLGQRSLSRHRAT